jgi:glycerol-3-phosphate acyltransferase PlsY
VTLPLALALAAAYLLGSIPFSLLVARRWGVEDVRRVGSGNVGATNVMRAAGKLPGAIAFALDASKGAAAVLLARWLGLGEAAEAGSDPGERRSGGPESGSEPIVLSGQISGEGTP